MSTLKLRDQRKREARRWNKIIQEKTEKLNKKRDEIKSCKNELQNDTNKEEAAKLEAESKEEAAKLEAESKADGSYRPPARWTSSGLTGSIVLGCVEKAATGGTYEGASALMEVFEYFDEDEADGWGGSREEIEELLAAGIGIKGTRYRVRGK